MYANLHSSDSLVVSLQRMLSVFGKAGGTLLIVILAQARI
jgi:hypothetical protein